ncbi:protein FAM118A isoform X4 [Rhinolophus ferrumequinum]|uniref:protein FAM118A isoform X4 n=1 Tax=Rhinolophus ferrumequinum TaxID=59479 RepID=UPI00140F8C7B|nr:protein FAM118A isoform X4 [Rhinolophus ferrumequinum]
MDSVEKTPNRSEQKSSRKFLKSLIRKQPQELLLVIGTGVSAAVAPGIPALCSWRSCIEAVLEAAEQLEVLHPGDVAEFRRKVTKDRDLLVVAHDLIRKMSPRTGDTKPNFFQDCLMEIFDNLELHIQNPLVLQSILSLMERGTMVLTTNYDNLLELFGQQQNKPMESLDLKDKTKEALQNLYRTKSFLFVGCGETLRDQIFQALFLYSVPNKVDLEHYMVVLKESEDHFFKQQADMLLHGIKVVSYGDCFDDFPGYVQDLASQICKQRSPVPGGPGPHVNPRELGLLERAAERLPSPAEAPFPDLGSCRGPERSLGLVINADQVDSTTLLGNACQDCAKRKLEENGIEVAKKLRQSEDAGGS